MRTLLALVILCFVACTVQSRGQRCEQLADCDTAAGDLCRRELDPSQSCGNNESCICCPATGTGGIAACGGGARNVDAGPTADR